MNAELCIHLYMIRKKYVIYVQEKRLYSNIYNHYTNIMITINIMQHANQYIALIQNKYTVIPQ